MLKKLPIYKIIPVESDFTEIAIVDDPAIEEFALMFNKDENQLPLNFNSEKMEIYGAVMKPNQLIYRNDKYGERFVMYDEDGIKKSVELFLKNGFKFNVEHTKKNVDVQIIESFFATENNNDLNVPIGSWIVRAKVNDEKFWKQLKNNEKFGFSFQANFLNEIVGVKEINFNKQIQNNSMSLKEKIVKFLNEVLVEDETMVETAPMDNNVTGTTTETEVEYKIVETADGKKIKYTDSENGLLSVGMDVMSITVNEDGTETIAPLEDGEYEIENNIYVIVDGKVSEIKEKPATDENFASQVPNTESQPVAEKVNLLAPITRAEIDTMFRDFELKIMEEISKINTNISVFSKQPIEEPTDVETVQTVEFSTNEQYSYLNKIND